MRSGDPDLVALHHDLYRACGKGRWWVMEQQPGPVNWAPYNPAPLPGMVRFWALEAFAHGAEVVIFFAGGKRRSARNNTTRDLTSPPAKQTALAARSANSKTSFLYLRERRRSEATSRLYSITRRHGRSISSRNQVSSSISTRSTDFTAPLGVWD